MIPLSFVYFTIPIAIISIYLYSKDILFGTVRPNKITWLFWGIAPLVGFFIGYKSGISFPILLTTFLSGVGCFIIFGIALFNKNAYWKITPFDIGCGIISAFSIIIWAYTKNGVLALAFAIFADFFAGIPTMIKSWRYSKTESALPYVLSILNIAITFLILEDITFLNFAFPLYMALANFVIILGIKHESLGRILERK